MTELLSSDDHHHLLQARNLVWQQRKLTNSPFLRENVIHNILILLSQYSCVQSNVHREMILPVWCGTGTVDCATYIYLQVADETFFLINLIPPYSWNPVSKHTSFWLIVVVE
uniref:Uncharacterized protein n=1 Tax=Seriola lalandi dorsalis TaxID=1841481 RepID=A0A3B4WJG5_SERLL